MYILVLVLVDKGNYHDFFFSYPEFYLLQNPVVCIILLYFDHVYNIPTGAAASQEITKSDLKGQNPEMQAMGKLMEQINEILLYNYPL